MNPLGMLVGLFIGILAVFLPCIAAPLVVFLRQPRIGVCRWIWVFAALLPGLVLLSGFVIDWIPLNKGWALVYPVWAIVTCAVYWFLTRPETAAS
jgi:hypothetical protein